MNELQDKSDIRTALHWRLLSGVSAIALIAYITSAEIVRAEDADRPQVWIELGGDLSRLGDSQSTFAPALFDSRPADFSPSQKFEKPPRYSIDEFASVIFQPKGSDWSISASLRYGRSASHRHVHQQTYPGPYPKYIGTYVKLRYPYAARFADTGFHDSERHFILDFQAGKDVGLGILGAHSVSTISLGVRFAQFTNGTNIALASDPDWEFRAQHVGHRYVPIQPYHSNRAELLADRSFHGIGPSLSWKSSDPVAGDALEGQLLFDWGANAAILFGKQKARVHHQTTGLYQPGALLYPSPAYTVYHPTPVNATRSRSITIPNVGGFAGLSFKYAAAKVSFGYKADFFFGAMDGGTDAHKSYDRNFFGPYATISIGLGG